MFIPNEKLRIQRERHFWTQKQLAEKIGTTDYNVSRWERGVTFPGIYYRQKLCEIFQLSPEQLGLIQNGSNVPTLPEMQSELTEKTQELSARNTAADPQLGSASIDSEDAPNTSQDHEFHTFATLPFRLTTRILVLAVLCLIVVGVSLLGLNKYYSIIHHIKPGGSWISPKNGETIHHLIHLAAYAFPTNTSDPGIDHVNFTLWWPGVDPRKWIIACSPHLTAAKDIYECDIDLTQLKAPQGQIRISFDVYDKMGNVNLAPNGERDILYTST